MALHVVTLFIAASNPNPCRRIQKVRKTLLRTSGRVYRTLAFDALHHGKFACHMLRELSNFCCLPGRAGGSSNGLAGVTDRGTKHIQPKTSVKDWLRAHAAGLVAYG